MAFARYGESFAQHMILRLTDEDKVASSARKPWDNLKGSKFAVS